MYVMSMSQTPWEELIVHCANGRAICNCRQAYADCVMRVNGQLVGPLICRNGCSANMIEAKEHVAQCVMSELMTRA